MKAQGTSAIEKNRRVLGISNTYMRGRKWLEHADAAISQTLGEVRQLVVLPYALNDMNSYAAKLVEFFKKRNGA